MSETMDLIVLPDQTTSTNQDAVVQRINRIKQLVQETAPKPVVVPARFYGGGSLSMSTKLHSVGHYNIRHLVPAVPAVPSVPVIPTPAAVVLDAAAGVRVSIQRYVTAMHKVLTKYAIEAMKASLGGDSTRPLAVFRIGSDELSGSVNASACLTNEMSGKWFASVASSALESSSYRPTSWDKCLSKLTALETGDWDNAAGERPNAEAITKARDFIKLSLNRWLPPSRLSPSIVAGVGITFRRGNQKVYVEFRNTGSVHALFSDGVEDPVVEKIGPDASGYLGLIERAKKYLNE